MLRIGFHGAAREVTGSCHLLESGGKRVLLDCGLIQGGPERHERNREDFPFDVSDLDAVVLSHAHIDHSGRLAVLIRKGYAGPIYTTEPTADLLRILLADSGRIQEEDARWKIKRLRKQGKDWDWVQPLYTEEDGLQVVEQVRTVPFDEPRVVADGITVRFVKAGHILGAAIVELTVGRGADAKRVVFTGDLGVEGARLLSAPHAVPRPDVLIMESTYGNRQREDNGDRTERLHAIITRTVRRGGKVIIPAFAVGRTQEILARINDLVEAGRLPAIPIYVDSPMATAATRVFASHPEAYSTEARRLLHAGDEPLDFPGLSFTRSVDESKAINASRYPAVVISASGMCTAGRIKHHLAHTLEDTRNTVVFVGYQARGTLGRLLRDGVNPVRIHGNWHQVRAEIVEIDGFSAHADLDELLAWYGSLGGNPERTFLVHGEEEACTALAGTLRDRFDARVDVPHPGDTFDVE